MVEWQAADQFHHQVGVSRFGGAAIKDLGEKVDPSRIEIVCDVPGYKQVKPVGPAVPTKNQGAVEVDFVMEKIDRAAAAK